MGPCRALLLMLGVTAASVLTLSNPVTPEDDDLGYDQGQGPDYSGDEETSNHPPFQIPEKFRHRCQTYLLSSLQSLCPNKAGIIANYGPRGMGFSPDKLHPQSEYPSFSSRNENVVEACCKNSCTILKLLTFCPSTTTTTTTETPLPAPNPGGPERADETVDGANETRKERQSPFLPFLVALLALGLPKKQKEPYSKDGQNGHNSNLQQGRRQTLEIDFIVEREDFDGGEDSGGVKLAHVLPGPAAASKSGSSGCKKPVFGEANCINGRRGKGKGRGGRRKGSSSKGRADESIRDLDPNIRIGSHSGTRDGIRH